MSLSMRDFAGLSESKQLRSRTPTPSILESSGASYKALRDASKTPRRHRRIPTSTFSSRLRERPKLVAAIILLVLSVWMILYLLRDLLMMARFKLRDRAYEEGWVKSCGLRKRPLLFVRGEGEVSVVWETNCEQEFELAWGVEQAVPGRWGRTRKMVEQWETLRAKRVQLPDQTKTHFVYSAILAPLAGNTTYAYTLALHDSPSSLLASHSFPFHGPTSSPTTIHLAALSDNQFNLRTFHRILHTLHTFGRTLPSSPLPSLLLHLGDNVQNPHSLPQWQTDFWDPLTSFLPSAFGQSTPILLARGNHDWDSTGKNTYVGGSPPRREWLEATKREAREGARGTFLAYSPHARCRLLVLDSNLGPEEQVEQEEWLEWEMGRNEWKEASLRIAMVHVPPFLEYWDREAWTKGGESEWSSYVRHRLTPLLTTHHATLILAGHSHTYARGFLPLSLTPSYTTALSSSSLPPFALAAAHERGWEKMPEEMREEGTVYAVVGGAGGTLDRDRVEEWGFWESGERRFHAVWIVLRFGEVGRGEVEWEGKEVGERVYKVARRRGCEEEVVDVLEWKAVGLDGKVFDRFRIEAEGCA